MSDDVSITPKGSVVVLEICCLPLLARNWRPPWAEHSTLHLCSLLISRTRQQVSLLLCIHSAGINAFYSSDSSYSRQIINQTIIFHKSFRCFRRKPWFDGFLFLVQWHWQHCCYTIPWASTISECFGITTGSTIWLFSGVVWTILLLQWFLGGNLWSTQMSVLGGNFPV